MVTAGSKTATCSSGEPFLPGEGREGDEAAKEAARKAAKDEANGATNPHDGSWNIIMVSRNFFAILTKNLNRVITRLLITQEQGRVTP